MKPNSILKQLGGNFVEEGKGILSCKFIAAIGSLISQCAGLCNCLPSSKAKKNSQITIYVPQYKG